MQSREGSRLIDLPGEHWNQGCSHMVEPSRPLEELTGNVSEFLFNPAIFHTNYQGKR